MNSDNAARQPQFVDAHRSLHLVHSRAWEQGKPARAAKHKSGVRESHRMATFGLAAAALIAPAIWMGHALLHWLRVI